MAALARHFRPADGKAYQLGRITLTFKTSAADSGASSERYPVVSAGAGA